MQMTVFFGFILFLLAGLLSAGICYRTNPAVVLAGEFRCWQESELPEGHPPFSAFPDPVGNSWNAQCRRRQSGGSKGSGQCPSSKADDRADEKQCQCLAAFAGCSAVAVGVCAGAALTNTLLQAQEAGMKNKTVCCRQSGSCFRRFPEGG
ncbi:MAG: hypothetical protein ACLURV_06160 [Gallintestinimicrobium sp.]